MGHIDQNGYLQITDRVKDFIKSGGEWVSSLEIETLISQHPAVSEVAVIGAKDEKWGRAPGRVSRCKIGSAGRGRRHHSPHEDVRGRRPHPAYAVPKKVLLVKEIAKTSVGKIDKKLLRRQYLAALK